MKILTLRIGDVIAIGDEITLTLARLRSGQAALGIQAPKDIPIHRDDYKGQRCVHRWEAEDAGSRRCSLCGRREGI